MLNILKKYWQYIRMTTKRLLVYEQLKKKIITLGLAPGQPLNEDTLARELKISKTPVREALHQLGKDGFVENIPGKGFFVSPISLRDISEIFEVREMLESEAARKAVTRPNLEKKIDPLLGKFVSAETEAQKITASSFKPGDQIHLVMFEVLENEKLLNIYKGVHEHVVRIRHYFLDRYDTKRMKEAFDEHMEILRALKSRDPERAQKAVREHLGNSLDYLRRVL
jgi:DNA-binding GntR family transcriptional regulator